MRSIVLAIIITVCSLGALAQKPEDVLATATSHTFRVADLPAETQQSLAALPGRISSVRKAVFDQMIERRLLDLEAKSRGITTEKLIASEKAKIADPTPAQIKDIYDANQAALGDLTLEKARPQIIAFLRSAPEKKAFGTLVGRLKTKFAYTPGKDVNSPTLAAADVLAMIGTVRITVKDYDEVVKVALYELQASASDLILDGLDDVIYNALLADEAKAAGTDTGTVIAREVTNKMKDYSDEERTALETAFSSRLTEKYKVSVVYKPVEPLVQSVSVDDDPTQGSPNAPVTIVMFSDFQCSACSRTHPILKAVMAEYPGKIRFVVRDYPLESIHENAFNAALAANAANAQGKFFEFIDKLYSRQDALDTASLKKYAAEAGLNAKQFEIDFNSEKTASEIRKDIADGDSYVVNSTPTIFVNGMRVRHLSPEGFRAAIDRALSK